MYSQRGFDIDVGEDTRRDSIEIYEIKLNYLIIPLIVRVDSDNGVTYFLSGLEFTHVSTTDPLIKGENKLEYLTTSFVMVYYF